MRSGHPARLPGAAPVRDPRAASTSYFSGCSAEGQPAAKPKVPKGDAKARVLRQGLFIPCGRPRGPGDGLAAAILLLHRLYGTDVNHRPAGQLRWGTADRLDADRERRAVSQVSR